MKLLTPYKGLEHSLKYFRSQVMEGVPYAQQEIKPLKSVDGVWSYLKPRVKYKNDPKETELFQTLPTLLDNNFHGITGHGDCDCFSIAALTLLIANGFHDCGIVLVGRTRMYPVHIYVYAVENGKKRYLDLTNRNYDYQRPGYSYKQEIPFNLTQNDKNMMLQLADAPRKRKRVTSMQRSIPHVWMPSKGVQVREDVYDGLSHNEYVGMLADEGYDLQEIQLLAGGRKARRAERKANKPRQIKKKDKIVAKREKRAAKTDKIKAKAQLKRDKGEAKRLKGQAKIDKANNGGGFDWEKAADIGGNLIGKFAKGGNSAEDYIQGAVEGYQQYRAPEQESMPDGSYNARVNTSRTMPSNTMPTNYDEPPNYDEYVDQNEEYDGAPPPKIKPRKASKKGIFEGSFNVFGMEIPKAVAYGAVAVGGYVAYRRFK